MQNKKVALLAAPLAMLALSTTTLLGDSHDKETEVTITEAVQVPGGAVLAPGTYMFILNNSSSNRNIVEIRSQSGQHLDAIMFTTRATRANRTGKTVLTFYEMPAGQPPALREWFWPGDYDGQEFLYPHSEAGRIGQASNERVPEVSDQEYSNLADQGFSTRYPANSSAVSGQSPAGIVNSDGQPSRSSNQTVQPGAHIVGDPGVNGRNGQDQPLSR